MLFDPAPGVLSPDALHGEEYAKAQQEVYEQTRKGPYGSPGMLMGLVSYDYSAPLTHFCQLIIEQLSDPTFANLQTFCIPCQLDISAGSDQIQFFSKPPEGKNRVSLLICLEHPLSRGSVHITPVDPLKPPLIDPGYFRNGANAKILAAGLK